MTKVLIDRAVAETMLEVLTFDKQLTADEHDQAVAALRKGLAQPTRDIPHCAAGPEYCPQCYKEATTQVEHVQELSTGWIAWAGGECPVARDAIVDVRYRCDPDAVAHTKAMADHFQWHDTDSTTDIVSFRVWCNVIQEDVRFNEGLHQEREHRLDEEQRLTQNKVVSKASYNKLRDDYNDLLEKSQQDAKHAKEWRAHVKKCQIYGVDLDFLYPASLATTVSECNKISNETCKELKADESIQTPGSKINWNLYNVTLRNKLAEHFRIDL
jgi:hypothetical protein